MSAGGVTAEEMEQAIENARTAVLRDPPWAPNARAFLAILTERDQLNAEVADLRRQLEERRVVVDPVDVANRAQLVTGRSIWPETVKAIISVLPDAVRPLSPGEVVVGREFLGMLESAANRFCSSCRDNNPSCTMTARHFGGTGCGAWKLDGARINALRSAQASAQRGEG